MISHYTSDIDGVRFVARAIRRDKGQLRADISIRHLAGTTSRELDRDEFRFSDRTKRNALANSAFTAADGAPGMPPKKEALQLLLRQFCDVVEEQWQESLKVEDVPGLAEPSTPSWVIRDYATEGSLTLLAAPPGAGKSWTGLLMAQSVQLAIPSVFEVYEPKPVLYVNLERSRHSLQNRLGLVNRVLGVDPTTPMPQINARGRSMQEVKEAIRRHIDKNNTEFTIVDSLSRMGMGSLSQDDSANEMMDTLNNLGTSTVVLSHPPRPQPGPSGKAAAERSQGSMMLTAAADFEVFMKSKDGPQQTLIGLKVIKANDAAKAPLTGWLYRYGPHGLISAKRADYVSDEDFEED